MGQTFRASKQTCATLNGPNILSLAYGLILVSWTTTLDLTVWRRWGPAFITSIPSKVPARRSRRLDACVCHCNNQIMSSLPPFFCPRHVRRATETRTKLKRRAKRKRSPPQAPGARAVLSSTLSAGSRLLRLSIQPRAQPTEVSPAWRNENKTNSMEVNDHGSYIL